MTSAWRRGSTARDGDRNDIDSPNQNQAASAVLVEAKFPTELHDDYGAPSAVWTLIEPSNAGGDALDVTIVRHFQMVAE